MTLSPRHLAFLAIVLAVLLHGALLPFTYGQTYDAYIHMFFADHYHRQWFDPWETRWYTGFTVTAYPPGSHQLIALLMHAMEMRAAFVTALTGAVTLLVIGIYRFSLIWVSRQAAAFAALLSVFSTSIAETVHLFGQLPTILSIALFLNGMPHMARWIERGGWRQLALALCFSAGATSAHHVTPLFGTLFFVAPIGLASWIAHLKRTGGSGRFQLSLTEALRWSAAPARGIVLGLCMLALIITIVFPYWYWSITDPITQVSIAHGSRESFIEKPNLGLIFFVIPWGLLIFVLPYVVKTLRSSLWPLGVTVLFALLLGTGGTTPLPKMILHGAFDILTLDRFTFWATLLILPIAGQLAVSLLQGQARAWLTAAFGRLAARLLLVTMFALYALAPIAVTLLPQVRPMQPDFVDPTPLATFMAEDGHDQWRYLTLGLGDQFAYHSAIIDAESVDGNYHSARRLPSLTGYAVERLENAKYAGVPGLASLNQFLTNADRFHLKFVFSNDEYYDPLLHYTGWNPVVRLSNGMMVWEKANIPPLPEQSGRRLLPRYQVLMWGILPMMGLGAAMLAFIGLAISGQLISGATGRPARNALKRPTHLVRLRLWSLRLIPVLLCLGMSSGVTVWTLQDRSATAEEQLKLYYGHLDFREYQDAYALLSTDTSFSEFLRDQRLRGGLLPSYGKLIAVETRPSQSEGEDEGQRENEAAKVDATLTYLTALGQKTVEVSHSWRDGGLVYQTPVRKAGSDIVRRQSGSDFLDYSSRHIIRPEQEAVARLQRPRLEASAAQLYEKDGRFFVTGQITNSSPFPACIQATASLLDADGNVMATQNMGRIGAHRLPPGARSPYKIQFEGYLKLSEATAQTAYDPELFSLPELPAPPANAKLSIQSTICAPKIATDMGIRDVSLEGNTLSFTLENHGTDILNTLQMKLDIVSNSQRWVQAVYIEENLSPGARQRVRVALEDRPDALAQLATARINGIPTDLTGDTEGTYQLGDLSVDIALDAMVYDLLR